MDSGYSSLVELNGDLIELMYGIREPTNMTDDLRHPLEDVVFTYDEIMAIPHRVYALAVSFGLYVPSVRDEISGYFYMALKSILYGEANKKYPKYLPTPGEMFRFTKKEFQAWQTVFLRAKKEGVAEELLYRLTVDDIYMDRMSVFLYYSTKDTDQDHFHAQRISHSGEPLNYTYIAEISD